MNDSNPSLSKRAVKQQAWQQLLTHWKQSGLTAKQFSQEQQIKTADLKRWGYRLNKMQRDALLKNIPTNHAIAKKFIPVTVSHATVESTKPGGIDIVLGKNILLRLTKQFDEELLLRLIVLLRSVESC